MSAHAITGSSPRSIQTSTEALESVHTVNYPFQVTAQIESGRKQEGYTSRDLYALTLERTLAALPHLCRCLALVS